MGEIKTDMSFQSLYRYVLDDLCEHPALEKDVGKLQKLYQLHRRQWVTIWWTVDVNTDTVIQYVLYFENL